MPEANTSNAPGSSNPVASTIAEGIIAKATDAAAATSTQADLNGSSRSQLAHIVTLPQVNPTGTSEPPQSFARSPMTAQQHSAPTTADQQASAAHAWYNAVLAAGQNPDALASILSLINAEAARSQQSPGQPPQAASAPADAAVRARPAEAVGSAAASPLNATLQQLLQASPASNREPPKDPVPSQKHLISQPQQVTTGDLHAHLHSSMRPHAGLLPDAAQPEGVKAGPPARADPAAPPWPQGPDRGQPSSQLVQQGSAKLGSEVLKRTFERPESPPSKRSRFQGGLAELQQELSRRALEGSSAPGSLPQDAYTPPVKAEARSRRPQTQDLQAKDLTDMVRRDSTPQARPENTFLKHLMDSIPRDAGAAAASDWRLQGSEHGRSSLARMMQPLPKPKPVPQPTPQAAPAPASAAPAQHLTATQLLQKSLISELTGQAPRRLLDQLDPGTLGLILATTGASTPPSQPPASAPPAPLLPAVPADPLASPALHLLQRTVPPEPARPAPPPRAGAPEPPVSPHSVEQLYMRLEKALGAAGAASILSSHSPKPAVQPVQPPTPSPQSQLLDVLQALVSPASALPPLHMCRDAPGAPALEPARDGHGAAVPLASRAPLSVAVPAASHVPRPHPATQPASFASAAQPSRRKQSPMLSLLGDRSTGLRAPRTVDAAGMPHFGAPQLLTSSDLAKPVAPQLAMGAVDLRSGPAASLATPLQHHAAGAAHSRGEPPMAVPELSVSSIIEALTGTGSMTPQARHRTLAAIPYITEHPPMDRDASAPTKPATEAQAASAVPASTPAQDAPKPAAAAGISEPPVPSPSRAGPAPTTVSPDTVLAWQPCL